MNLFIDVIGTGLLLINLISFVTYQEVPRVSIALASIYVIYKYSYAMSRRGE